MRTFLKKVLILFNHVIIHNYIALPAFKVLKQLVQMCIFLDVPLTTVLTGLTFAFQVLLDLLWEWLTLIPKATPLPQISHFAIYMHLLLIIHSIKN